MRKKRPHPATLDEVRISRDCEDAIIEFVDSTAATMHLKLGPEVQQMTDEEILDSFNAVVIAMQQRAAEYEHVVVDVPPGSPQITYFQPGDQWVPRGAVLRCIIDEEDGEAVVTIDDHELNCCRDAVPHACPATAGWLLRLPPRPVSESPAPPPSAASERHRADQRPAQFLGSASQLIVSCELVDSTSSIRSARAVSFTCAEAVLA